MYFLITDSAKKKSSLPPPIKSLSKNSSVPQMLESSSATTKALKKQKSNNPKLGSYKASEDNFLKSSALARNGDYAIKSDSWQKVETSNRNRKPPSPVVGISGTSLSSDNDLNFEEAKYLSSANNWSKEDSNYIQKLVSSKRK